MKMVIVNIESMGTKSSIFLLLLATIILNSSCGTSIEITKTNKATNLAVKSNKFRGTIFRETYPFIMLHVSDINSTSRFTLDSEEIRQAERLLREQIKDLNSSRPNQVNGSPVIHKNINKYFRQYVGFVNKNGEKVVHINFYWDRFSFTEKIKGYTDSRLTFEDEYAIVFDGGSHYWQVNINLTTGKVSDLQVNGVA
jgi:hypothetical protein